MSAVTRPLAKAGTGGLVAPPDHSNLLTASG